jgi:hypothetical protein
VVALPGGGWVEGWVEVRGGDAAADREALAVASHLRRLPLLARLLTHALSSSIYQPPDRWIIKEPEAGRNYVDKWPKEREFNKLREARD